MKSLKRLGLRPASLPLLADDVLEFHAARLLLLLRVCGISGRIDGLTKLAKMDFFVRYPDFFEVARREVQSERSKDLLPTAESDVASTESAMVRHHYGPWDKRYYQLLALLEAKKLITVSKEGNSYRISLTDLGVDRAIALSAKTSFKPLVVRMKGVKAVFGQKTGAYLKNLIYRLFDEEVGKRPLGESID